MTDVAPRTALVSGEGEGSLQCNHGSDQLDLE